MIVIFFSCDECHTEVEVALTEFSALQYQPLPKGWVWVSDHGYCRECRRYAGISIGEV